MTNKLCVRCVHYIRAVPTLTYAIAARCGRSELRSPVTGGAIVPCYQAREENSLCGMGGRWFEEKPKSLPWYKRMFK